MAGETVSFQCKHEQFLWNCTVWFAVHRISSKREASCTEECSWQWGCLIHPAIVIGANTSSCFLLCGGPKVCFILRSELNGSFVSGLIAVHAFWVLLTSGLCESGLVILPTGTSQSVCAGQEMVQTLTVQAFSFSLCFEHFVLDRNWMDVKVGRRWKRFTYVQWMRSPLAVWIQLLCILVSYESVRWIMVFIMWCNSHLDGAFDRWLEGKKGRECWFACL